MYKQGRKRRLPTKSLPRNPAAYLPRIVAEFVVAIVVVASSVAAAQNGSASADRQPLATIAGQPVYANDLPSGDQAQLFRMMQQVYAVQQRALRTALERKLLEEKARQKGVTVDQFIQTEVASKIPDPSEQVVSQYYQTHPMQQPYDAVKDKLREELKEVDIQKAVRLYVDALLQQAVNEGTVVVLLRPPKVQVTADPARMRGDPHAPVTIVEFSDFSCPFCRKEEATLQDLLSKYQGKVRLSYRDFPLSQLHPQAEQAAEASHCAGDQGKYWEYHDMLFANPGNASRDDLMADARALKLDDKKFEECLNSGRYQMAVRRDMEEGASSGVVATPGFFVNGTFLNGAQPEDVFEKIIDKELAAGPQAPVQPELSIDKKSE